MFPGLFELSIQVCRPAVSVCYSSTLSVTYYDEGLKGASLSCADWGPTSPIGDTHPVSKAYACARRITLTVLARLRLTR